MKKLTLAAVGIFVFCSLFMSSVDAQEEESASPFSIGADVVSNYVWRGTKFGGPSIQPGIELGLGNFAIGAWGSFSLNGFDIAENDLYLSYSIGDLGLTVTDYYYQGPLFDFSDSTGSHALEISASYSIKGLNLTAGYVVNEAGGAASAGGDIYVELGYSFKHFSIFAGAGNGWYTIEDAGEDDIFGIVNAGISAEKEIKIGEYAIPVSGSVIVNPQAEVAYLVVGFSF
ncbi:MAG: hypothetical protein JXB00_10865 [Bacteroidales bacterium]|nr:hypothetical protein [Bacteroidales bacterium]